MGNIWETKVKLHKNGKTLYTLPSLALCTTGDGSGFFFSSSYWNIKVCGIQWNPSIKATTGE